MLTNRIYIDNPLCATTAINLEIKHTVAAFGGGHSLGLKNVKIGFLECVLDCLECSDSKSCTRCKEGMFLYERTLNGSITEFYCGIPYNVLPLVSDEVDGVFEVKSFLFRPGSFFMFWKQEMNFTAEMETVQPYFIADSFSLDFSQDTPFRRRSLEYEGIK